MNNDKMQQQQIGPGPILRSSIDPGQPQRDDLQRMDPCHH